MTTTSSRMEQDFWVAKEYGPKVTAAERDERAHIALLVLETWDLVRKMARPRRGVLPNLVCFPLVEAFATAMCFYCDHRSSAIVHMMDTIATHSTVEARLHAIRARLDNLTGYRVDLWRRGYGHAEEKR